MKKLIIGITAPQSVDLINGQLNYFVGKGYDVYLLAPKTDQVVNFCIKENVKHLPIKIKRNINPFFDLISLIQIIFIFMRVKPDIVNLGTPKVSLVGMLAAKITGVPKRIYTCRGFRFEPESGFLRKFLISLEKLIVSCSHKVICISNSIKEMGIAEGIFDESKTVTFGKGSSNGLNLTMFSRDAVSDNERAECIQQYNLQDTFIFGFVGRIADRKGIQELYVAFDNMYKKNRRFRLFVVGRPYWDQIKDKKIIDLYNSHEGIIMVGLQPITKIPLFLSVFDIFMMPGWGEGFGNVLIQAAAMGVPIISTNTTGCKDAVSDGFNGKLIQAQNPVQLEETMQHFHDNPEETRLYGNNGVLWSKNFDPEVIWKGMQEIYESEFH